MFVYCGTRSGANVIKKNIVVLVAESLLNSDRNIKRRRLLASFDLPVVRPRYSDCVAKCLLSISESFAQRYQFLPRAIISFLLYKAGISGVIQL